MQIPLSLIRARPQWEQTSLSLEEKSSERQFLHNGIRSVRLEQQRHFSPPSTSETRFCTNEIAAKYNAKNRFSKTIDVLFPFITILFEKKITFRQSESIIFCYICKILQIFRFYRPLRDFFHLATKSRACLGVISSGSQLKISSRTSSSSVNNPGKVVDFSSGVSVAV